jgi:hypothetical protein
MRGVKQKSRFAAAVSCPPGKAGRVLIGRISTTNESIDPVRPSQIPWGHLKVIDKLFI